jgi:hypothetical protein
MMPRMKPDHAAVPLHAQIAELRRELAMRQNVYPRRISEGKMKPQEAELCMARLQAAHDTLVWCQEHRDVIIAAKRQLGEGGSA